MKINKDIISWLIGTIIIGLLLFLGIIFHIGILTFISVIIFLLFQTIAVVSLKQTKDNNKRKKQQLEYNNQYITNIEINDDRYGEITVKHDILKHEYNATINNIKFDNEILVAELGCTDKIDIERVLKELKTFCDNGAAMKNKIFSGLANYLKNGDNFDENNNPIEITEQFLRKKFKFKYIHLNNGDTIELLGSWEDSGNQDYSIIYYVFDNKFEYMLL